MQIRKDQLVTGYYYHVFSRSIAGFVIFNNKHDFQRLINALDLFRYEDFTYKYSEFLRLDISTQSIIKSNILNSNKIVEIVAYCIMPTHIHLILKQLVSDGISRFMSKLLNSYSRYFNQKHKRIGPLWAGRFKNVVIKNDEQLLHLTRYLHLNPTSAGLVEKPEDWLYSSYLEYLSNQNERCITRRNDLLNIEPPRYQKFVNDHKNYQRQLSIIKSSLIDNYTG